MSDILPSVVYQLGLGGIGGFIVGYSIKKISKLIVVLIGIFVVALLYLGTRGIISINYDELWDALISLLPFMGSFLAGFVLGFKLG